MTQDDLLARIKKFSYSRQAGTQGEKAAFLELAREIESQGLSSRFQDVPITYFETIKGFLQVISPIEKKIECVPVGMTGSLDEDRLFELVYTEKGAKGDYQGELSEKIALVFGPVRCIEYQALARQKARAVIVIGEPGRPINYYCMPITYPDRWGDLPTVTVGFEDGLWLARQENLQVSLSIEQKRKRGESLNLIVTINGRRKTRKNIVIGAHFDTVQNVPGVQDNLAACIVMVELAKEFARQEGDLDLHFVWFGGEELGGMEGSFRFVRQETDIVTNTQCMINLDGTGGIIGTNRIRVMGNETVDRFVRKLALLEKEKWNIDSGIYWTDGVPFCDANIPCINVFRDGGTYDFVHSISDGSEMIHPRHLKVYYGFVQRLIQALRDQEYSFQRRISLKMQKELKKFYRENLGILEES